MKPAPNASFECKLVRHCPVREPTSFAFKSLELQNPGKNYNLLAPRERTLVSIRFLERVSNNELNPLLLFESKLELGSAFKFVVES